VDTESSLPSWELATWDWLELGTWNWLKAVTRHSRQGKRSRPDSRICIPYKGAAVFWGHAGFTEGWGWCARAAAVVRKAFGAVCSQ